MNSNQPAPIHPHNRILLIDDNPSIHEDFKKIFAGENDQGLDSSRADLFGDAESTPKADGFILESAFQGQEGLQRVEQACTAGCPYAMAFVDMRMPPGWDGVETISKIWAVYPDLQVVVCTAYSDYTLEDMIAKLGRTDRFVLLKKPFDNAEVLQLANALTEKWRLLQQARSHIGGLEAAVAERTVELRCNEARFRSLSESSPIGIFMTDAAGLCIYTNERLQEIAGLTSEQALGEGWAKAVHPEDRAQVFEKWTTAARTGAEFDYEARFLRPDGVVSWFHARARALPSSAEQLTGHVGTVEDITAARLADQEHSQMEIQLRHAQKMESIGQLAAGIAHEINTPTQYIGDNTRFVQDAFGDITRLVAEYDKLFTAAEAGAVTPEVLGAVKAAAAAADMAYLSAEIPKAIQQSLDGVSRVTNIVRAMKEFSHPGTTEKTAVDLAKTIQSTITVASNEWKYVAELVTEFDPALPPVSCLPGEFNQVVLNLIVNASHAIADVVGESGTKGTITVSARRDGEWAEVRIRDTGTGIPEKARAKVFDPFFTTKGVGKGTGQGLAIAHNVIVEKHGGTLAFETETGKGTVFIIRIPIQSVSNQERKAA